MTIRGLDKLNKKLDRLASEKTYAAPLQKGAMLVERDAKIAAPVDTSMLRKSISSKVDIPNGRATVGTNLSYAPYVEFGTGIFSSLGTGRNTPWSYQDEKGNWHTTSGQVAQPYLRPSFNKNRERIVEEFVKTLNKEVTR